MTDDIAATAARILIDTQSVMFNAREPFKYTSGNIGPVYVDCRRPLSFAAERAQLMTLATQVIGSGVGSDAIDIVAGAETAGIPYAAIIAERLGKPMVYVRKKPKGHGRMGQIEGYFDPERTPHILLVEDLQNFGHSKQIFVEALRGAGAVVTDVFVLFDYGTRPEVKAENDAMGLRLHSLCTWHDVLALARKEKYFDTATLDSVAHYLADPAGWTAAQTPRTESA